MNSDRRFIMFFSPFLFPHELWSASPGTFSQADSKLNAVCCHATQERMGQVGIYWLTLLWPKHLQYVPPSVSRHRNLSEKLQEGKNIIPPPHIHTPIFYSNITHSQVSSSDIKAIKS